MKVLHINSYYSNRFFYKNLYDRQRQQGIEINVYVPVANNYIKPESDLGEYTLTSKSYRKYDRAIFQVKHYKILKDIKTQYNINDYSLLHAHSLFSNGYIAYKLNQEYQVPYIVAVRNTDLNTFFKYMVHLRGMGIEILKNANKIVFLSIALREELIHKYVPDNLKKAFLEKSIIIPNGLDPYWLSHKAETKVKPKDKKINLLQVGLINKGKNAVTTAKAAKILINKGYQVNLNIIGRIENQTIFKNLIKKKYVHYFKPIPKEELSVLYRNNDIYVMPSLHETFGLVYAEAMSQGLPVLYSKGQGFDGQFPEGEVGYSVKKTNANDIAEKILLVVENYENLSKKAIKNTDKFDWDRLTIEYMQLYKSSSKKL